MVGEQACQGALTRSEHSGAAAHSRWVISVSLRTAASVEAPSTPMSLNPRLQGMGGSERAGGCQRALTQKQTLGAAAHLSLVICVSLRMAASAEAPLSPMSLL